MALPESHLETLNRHFRAHDQRLAFLRDQQEVIEREIRDQEASDLSGRDLAKQASRDPKRMPKGKHSVAFLRTQLGAIEREIRIHETLVAFGRDRRTLDALNEIAENVELAKEASRDPKAFARDRGIDIPKNMTIEVKVDGDQVSLRAVHYDDLYPFVVTWDRTGFSEP